MLTSYDKVISLGATCESATHIKRLKLPSVHSPFDWMVTTHDALCKCLTPALPDLMLDGDAHHITCRTSGLQIYHHGLPIDEIKSKLQYKARCFLQATKYRCVFIRTVPRFPDGLIDWSEDQPDEIDRLLDALGFKHRKLIYVVKGRPVEHPSAVSVRDGLFGPKSEWPWNYDEWDRLISDRLPPLALENSDDPDNRSA